MSSTSINFSYDKLVGCENFPIWYITICDYLKSLKLNLYIETNVTSTITDLTTEMDHNVNDAKASIIILTNVIDKIKYYIKDCATAYEKMEKLKSLYEVDKATFCGIRRNDISYIIYKNIQKSTKTCIICNKQGHLAKDCYFNPCSTNKRNSRSLNYFNNNNNNNNLKNKMNNKRNTNNKENYNRKQSKNYNTISNIEKEYTPSYEEFNFMYGNNIDSIEYDKEKILDKLCNNNINYCSENDTHLTSEMNILNTKCVRS
ncbi:hypothetical protein BCR36DRAFT_307710 [Piromyces finnis]|uniref:CCHC-type domain-containing protein n=1 Tax=Piromyces finnis TaxID=1754191 RepID=A0A1Y1UXP8_9FUNG|nr:hypothetical protein BCR36DRAFT_307710 [Piromyces finnis]|eukprot:ORX42304.1 hypothetical protein BCR36DRAFT_307710 [Piromyces finnis]